MKILMMTRFYLNGQTTHVFSLCKALKTQGHQCFLVVTYLDNPGYIRWLQTQRIPFVRTPKLDSLLPLFRQQRFDVIHTHSAHTLLPALDLGQKLGIPVVATCHYLDFRMRVPLLQADRIVAISPEMARDLALPSHKTQIIENGVEIPSARRKLWKSPTATIVARITKQREVGFTRLTRIMQEKGWRIMSVGSGRIANASIRNLGWCQSVYDPLRQSDVVIGTGRAIREGMACGCVGFVIGDHCDGLVTPDTVDLLRMRNFSGRATTKATTSENLSEQFARITEDSLPELRRFSTLYARRHFDIGKMTQRLIRVYGTCAAVHRAPLLTVHR